MTQYFPCHVIRFTNLHSYILYLLAITIYSVKLYNVQVLLYIFMSSNWLKSSVSDHFVLLIPLMFIRSIYAFCTKKKSLIHKFISLNIHIMYSTVCKTYFYQDTVLSFAVNKTRNRKWFFKNQMYHYCYRAQTWSYKCIQNRTKTYVVVTLFRAKEENYFVC